MELTEKEKAFQEMSKTIGELYDKNKQYGLEIFLLLHNSENGDCRMTATVSPKVLTISIAKFLTDHLKVLPGDIQDKLKKGIIQEFTKLMMSLENHDSESVTIDA